MTFTEKDICDDGGYLLSPMWVLKKVNERILKLIKERDEARELCKLAGQTMATHSMLIQGAAEEWETKE